MWLKASSDECIRNAFRSSNETRMFVGANAMRSLLALGLLITLCAYTSAAAAQHSRHPFIVRPGQGWIYAAPRPSVDTDDIPSYNDPSKYGGGTALAVTR